MNFIHEGVEKYAYDHTKAESDLFQRLRDETHREMQYPQMQVGRLEGQFLKMLVRLTGRGAFSKSACLPVTAG